MGAVPKNVLAPPPPNGTDPCGVSPFLALLLALDERYELLRLRSRHRPRANRRAHDALGKALDDLRVRVLDRLKQVRLVRGHRLSCRKLHLRAVEPLERRAYELRAGQRMAARAAEALEELRAGCGRTA